MIEHPCAANDVYSQRATVGVTFQGGGAVFRRKFKPDAHHGKQLPCTSCLRCIYYISPNFGLLQLHLRNFPYVLISNLFCFSSCVYSSQFSWYHTCIRDTKSYKIIQSRSISESRFWFTDSDYSDVQYNTKAWFAVS
jgi:hypothetical protein